MNIEVQYKDVEQLIPQLALAIERRIESNRFISYPTGMQKYLCDGEVSEKTYQRVRNLWNKPSFPRKGEGSIKGVYLSELKEYQKLNSSA